MRSWAATPLLAFLLTVSSSFAGGKDRLWIDWQSLHNPVLFYPHWSIKDSAMAWRDGTFYIFFSAFYADRGQVRSHVVEVSTRDFRHYSQPIFNFDGEEAGWIGMCSPDVQRSGTEYIMTFNSWGDKPGKPDALFYMSSKDLVHWSRRLPLAANLTADRRVIDAAIASAGGGYYLMYKEGTKQMRPRVAFSSALSQSFKFVGDGFPQLLMSSGKENGLIHENYEFLHSNDQWYLLTTDYNPPGPYLYKLDTGSGWLKWTQGYKLEIPQEKFNTDNLANAAALYDWRKHDGYYYLIYAGRTELVSYAKRGWNSLGLARSKDLVHWSVAGQMQ